MIEESDKLKILEDYRSTVEFLYKLMATVCNNNQELIDLSIQVHNAMAKCNDLLAIYAHLVSVDLGEECSCNPLTVTVCEFCKKENLFKAWKIERNNKDGY